MKIPSRRGHHEQQPARRMFLRRTRNTTSRSKVERSRIQRRAGTGRPKQALSHQGQRPLCQVARGIGGAPDERVRLPAKLTVGSRVQRVSYQEGHSPTLDEERGEGRVRVTRITMSSSLPRLTWIHITLRLTDENTHDRFARGDWTCGPPRPRDTTSVMAKLMGATEWPTSGVCRSQDVFTQQGREEQCSHFPLLAN